MSFILSVNNNTFLCHKNVDIIINKNGKCGENTLEVLENIKRRERWGGGSLPNDMTTRWVGVL